MSNAIIVCADGFEEIEAVAPADILRRAGVSVELVGLDGEEVRGAHDIVFKMDRALAAEETADAVILPGGLPGAENLAASTKLDGVLKAQADAGRMIAAICASPGLVLGPKGLLKGRRATCYPGFEKHFGADAAHVDQAVVRDGNLLTSQGPGTAFAFGLALASALAGDAVARQLAKGMLHGT